MDPELEADDSDFPQHRSSLKYVCWIWPKRAARANLSRFFTVFRHSVRAIQYSSPGTALTRQLKGNAMTCLAAIAHSGLWPLNGRGHTRQVCSLSKVNRPCHRAAVTSQFDPTWHRERSRD